MPIIKPTSPRPPSPRSAWDPLQRLARLARRPLDRFFRIDAASGILLIAAAVVALGWANSPWADGYLRLWQTPVGFDMGTDYARLSLSKLGRV